MARLTGRARDAALGVGSAVGGAAIGHGVGSRAAAEEEQWAAQIRAEDERMLRAGRIPPSIPEPADPGIRKEKGMARCYLTGVATGGVGVWLIVFLVMLLVTRATNPEMMVGELILGAQIFAFPAGLAGFVVPGVLIGAGLWLHESRQRMEQLRAGFRRSTWEQREWMRAELTAGRLTAPQALQQITAGPPVTPGPSA